MAENQVLILHGWSDTSGSFRQLAKFLASEGFQTTPLWLGDYISMDDDVSIRDVAKRMQTVIENKLSSGELARGFSIIAHSTGGVVAREWLASYYADDIANCPAKRVLMLAPANFGSRLASLGQSMLGRVVKGFDNWFHTGKQMLSGLELASPYHWDLVRRELFVAHDDTSARAIYCEHGIWPFVVVGTHPYTSLLRQIVNENGSDGTVRVAAANLNVRGLTIDFAADETQPRLTPWKSRSEIDIPFAVLPDRDHATITSPGKAGVSMSNVPRFDEIVLAALRCPNWTSYQQIAKKWSQITETTAERGTTAAGGARVEDEEFFHQYLQVDVHVVDDHGAEIRDYFLEFSGPEEEKGTDSSVFFHKQVLEHVHTNGGNASYRCLYVDRTDLLERYYGKIRGDVAHILNLSISASPPGPNVQYFSELKSGARGVVTVHSQYDSPQFRWLQRNSTHFIEIVIPRVPQDKVFKVTRYTT